MRVLGLTSDGTPQVVVEVTPEDGLAERRFYDAQTHLLDRIEMVNFDGHKQVWNYSNYRQRVRTDARAPHRIRARRERR